MFGERGSQGARSLLVLFDQPVDKIAVVPSAQTLQPELFDHLLMQGQQFGTHPVRMQTFTRSR
ncbi:MAG: hypothetical protein ABIZ49_03970 [Opitutaceae bacterium]